MSSKKTAWTLILLIAFLAAAIESVAQPPLYLDAGLQRTSKQLAVYTVQPVASGNGTYKAEVRNNFGELILTGHYTPWKDTWIEHGAFIFYYTTGTIESQGEYDRGVRTGIWKRFEKTGQAKPDRFYSPEGAATLRKSLGYDQG